MEKIKKLAPDVATGILSLVIVGISGSLAGEQAVLMPFIAYLVGLHGHKPLAKWLKSKIK